MTDQPEPGKIYRLTGTSNQPSVAAGASWSASEVLPIIDQRDPEGAERMHTGEAADQLGVPRLDLGHPYTVSGATMRGPRNESASVQADLEREAARMLERWRALGSDWKSRDTGRGGSVRNRPVAIILHNYGASIATDDRQRRTEFFTE